MGSLQSTTIPTATARLIDYPTLDLRRTARKLQFPIFTREYPGRLVCSTSPDGDAGMANVRVNSIQ